MVLAARQLESKYGIHGSLYTWCYSHGMDSKCTTRGAPAHAREGKILPKQIVSVVLNMAIDLFLTMKQLEQAN
jgi:hypothetical protein